jgi:hypothetical protein
MRELGGGAAFCSSLCRECWSRYRGSRVCITRMQHWLQRPLEMVLCAESKLWVTLTHIIPFLFKVFILKTTYNILDLVGLVRQI